MERTDISYRNSGSGADARPERWRLRRSELLLIFAFWTFLAVLTAATRLLDPRGPGLQFGLPSGPVAAAFFEAYLWAVLTPLVFWLSSRLGMERSNWVRRILLFVGVGVVIALFVDMAADFARGHDFSPMRIVTRFWFVDELVVYIAVLAAGFAREYFVRYQVRQKEAVRLQAHTAQLQAQLVEARLEALRMQINPHFLFNTLHAVSTLVERDPRGVRRMIARLSELLRYTLDGAGEQEVPLEQELEFLERYLDIMQVRFQGRLEVDVQVESGLRDALVPNLILLPLVENAVKHGVSKTEGAGRIEVRAGREGERLVLGVSDNGPGFTGKGEAGVKNGAGRLEAGGVGLRNTRARLEQLYGTDQRLTIRSAENRGTIAEIELPYHTRADLRTTAVSGPPEESAHEP